VVIYPRYLEEVLVFVRNDSGFYSVNEENLIISLKMELPRWFSILMILHNYCAVFDNNEAKRL
jgi:hypothetical protein